MVRACPMAAGKCVCTELGWRFAERHYDTTWGLQKWTSYHGFHWEPVTGNHYSSAIEMIASHSPTTIIGPGGERVQ
jgi:hypothetical protein